MSDMKSGPRSRAPNFTREEQLLLCKIAEAYSKIIESKKTDGVKHAHKQEAWHKIQEIYNSNTKGVPRTVENLLSCYRNMKTKIKRQHSGAKMMLQDPKKKEALINALEENGEDWNAVSLQLCEPADVCESGYIEMQKALKKQDNRYKKSIMGTGGGPAPPPDNDEALEKLKKIIKPQVDGLFTIYDGDALLMKQYQESVPDSEKIQPIESDIQYDIVDEEVITEKINEDNNIITTSPIRTINRVDLLKKKKATPLYSADIQYDIVDEEVIPEKMKYEDNITTSPISTINRVDLLRKKKATPLYSADNRKSSMNKKETTNAAFQTLAETKLELVKLQKQVLEEEKYHQSKLQELILDDQIKQNKHSELMRQKKLQIMELELSDRLAENKYKEQLREKELLLLDLKIQNKKQL